MNVIFGAGATGKKALKKYGKESISFFVDNDTQKDGAFIQGIPVLAFDKALDRMRSAHIIIACKAWETMEKQLQKHDIRDYEIYGKEGYLDIPDVVFNMYEDPEVANKQWVREEINRQVLEIGEEDSFNHVEIETVNRCNGVCNFCPVNRNVDTREYKKMSIEVFRKIILELEEMDYNGRLALFSNNEPLLDERIIEFHKFARDHLPKARMHLCTNGTLLTIELFNELMKYLDELIIDNYNKELHVIPSIQKIVDYCESHPELKKKVTVMLRKPDEILTNRGGDAPNGIKTDEEYRTSCLLPYKQLIIRPDGKVSLCCNDALGRCTMGDLTEQTIREIWFGNRFSEARRALRSGRANFPRCKDCDTVFLC